MAYFTMNKAADSGLFVVESIRQHKDTVHERFVELWSEKRPGETPPNVGALLGFMADDLDEDRVEMVESLGTYLNESSANEVSNLERGDAVQDMRNWYQHARGACLNVCTDAKTREMGFDLATEQHPWRLERQAQRAISVFKGVDPEAKIETTDPEKQEVAPTHGYVVRVLEPPHARLVKILGDWIGQRRGTETALIRKDAALKSYQGKFSIYAKCSEMLYRWVGLEEEAKRIKPSTRRRGERAEADESSESLDAEPPSDAAASSGDAASGGAPATPAPANP
jgi:hypothetical protein